jgi:hypothetical protein
VKRCDLDLQHQLPDGTVQPAIKLFEWKVKDRTEAVWKPIPIAVAECIVAYLAFIDRYRRDVKNLPAVPDHAPLAFTQQWTPLDGNGYSRILGGQRPNPGDRNGGRAVLPKEGRPPYVGYSAHHVRSWARQSVDSDTCRRWLEDRRVDRPASWIAEALLGHDDNDLKKLYGGGSKRDDVELLSAIGTELTWRMLSTELGARKVLDADAYRDTVHAIKALEQEKTRLNEELDSIPDFKQRLRSELRNLETANEDERARDVWHQLEELRDREIDLAQKVARTAEELGELKLRKLALRNSSDHRRVISDDIPGAQVPRVSHEDLDRIDTEIYQGLRPSERGKSARLREWISLSELAGLVALSDDTLKRWLRDGFPAHMRGVPLWDEDSSPLTTWSTPKRRAFAVARLNQAHPLFQEPDLRRELELLLSTPFPAGWSRHFAGLPAT